MRLFERLYRSSLGRLMSVFGNYIADIQKPFMVYGYVDPATKEFRKYTRISSSAVIMNKDSLSINDHVWVWHYSILDATGGLVIEEGVQIGAWVGIFTHGSENAIRLLGNKFVNIPNHKRLGYTRGPVFIGKYSFIGAGSVILPGVTIGKGCLIGTGTLVNKNVPDYSVVVGSPGTIRASTVDLDRKFIQQFDLRDSYYDQETFEKIVNEINITENK